MPPKAFVDLRELDFETLQYDAEAIRQYNPHRHEFALLDGIVFRDAEAGIIVGYHDLQPDAYWIRGHIPGRPLFPGVLMIEVAAQVSSIYWRVQYQHPEKFFGFGGVDNVKFRGTVVPGDRFVIVGKLISIKPRRAIFDCQGFVGDTMVFEAQIKGMVV